MTVFEPQHVGSPGHLPGTLYDCPACDREMARTHYVEIVRGSRCALDLGDLSPEGKKLVELALRAGESEFGRPARDVLHLEINGPNDSTKAVVASWVCPEYVSDWQGDWQQRHDAERKAFERETWRMEDRTIEVAATLDPADNSLEARQIRGAAASSRDHKAARLRGRAWGLRDEVAGLRQKENELLDIARESFLERDSQLLLLHEAERVADWGLVAAHRREANRWDREGNEQVHAAIEARNLADEKTDQAAVLDAEADMLLAANEKEEGR